MDLLKKAFLKVQFSIIDFLKSHRNIFLILISAVVGISGGYCAIGFRLLIRYIQGVAIHWHDTERLLGHLMARTWQQNLMVPVVGGLIIGLIIQFISKEAREQGVPEVIKAIAFHGGRMKTRFVFIKSLASAITIGTGGSVGREGPIVHIGCSIGSKLGQIFRLSHERTKILVACGAAAGLAATFNAPITGVLFAIEVILGAFAIHTVSPIVVSSVLATMISRRHLGNNPALVVPSFQFRSARELALYFILGIAVGFIGLLFIKSTGWMDKFFRSIRLPVFLKTTIGMSFLGVLIIFFPQVYANGYETITLALSNNLDLNLMLILIGIKILATSVTLAAGGSGGVYSPALFIGAVTGGSFGYIAHLIFPDFTATENAYALVGMGALVSSIMHAPFTAIITMFELTGDYTIILPLMFACIVSSLVTTDFKKESIYTDQLKREGIDLDTGLETTLMKRNIVRDIMHEKVATIDPDLTFEKLFNVVTNSMNTHFYVVGLDNIYLGHLTVHDVIKVMKFEGLQSRRRAIDLMDKSYPRVHPDETLLECVKFFSSQGFNEFPVVADQGRFMGIINHQDIFLLYTREILQSSSTSLKFISKSTDTTRSDYVNIPEEYRIEVVPVMGKLSGKTIKDLELRRNYNVTVIAIRPLHSPSTPAEIPKPTRNLTRQDALIVVGQEDDLARMRREMGIAALRDYT